MPHYSTIFTINRLRVEALLGFYEHELSTRQPVDIELRLYFPAPSAAATDDHARVVDYAAISQKLVQLATARHYRTIEFLTERLFDAARAYVDTHDAEVKLWLRLTKVAPSVSHLRDGASLIRCDVPAGATTAPI